MDRDYVSIIPTEPPADLYAELRGQGKLTEEYLMYKAIGEADAEALTDWSGECGGDFRPRTRHARPAGIWCSVCGQRGIAEYIAARRKAPRRDSGIRLELEDMQPQEVYSGSVMYCPMCGAEVMLVGHNTADNEAEIVTATVVGDCVVFTQWAVARRVRRCIDHITEKVIVQPWWAYIVDGKRVVKLAHVRRTIGGYFYWLDQWEQLKRIGTDTVGVPYMYPAEPCLDDTPLENAKLWEYKRQAYDRNCFAPVAYARLYLRHNNVENLITAGLGELIGSALQAHMQYNSSGSLPRMEYINWRECKPAKMLGMAKDELRSVMSAGWSYRELEYYHKICGKLSVRDAIEAFGVWSPSTVSGIGTCCENAAEMSRTLRYMVKLPDGDEHIYADYLNMARHEVLDLTDPQVRYPAHLHAAHNRLIVAKRYADYPELRASFAAMTARCEGLRWARDGICIRPAETPEELVQEGRTLHHCVGGYARRHAGGQIILFIRHQRRPERSWYTLNVDVQTKKIIQNHGYKNEYVDGKRLHIPQRVQEFVAAWQREVLDKWTLPPAPKKQVDTDKRSA